MAQAALFSLSIEILDSPLSKFGNVRVRRSCDGVGTSGLCISQLSFDVPGDLYAPRAAKTVVDGVSGLPTYYIDNRSKSKGVYSVTCLDRLAFADLAFPIDQTLELDKIEIYGKANFPETGMVNKFYLDTATGTLYKWNGKQYIEASDDDYTPTLSISEVIQLIINTVGFADLTGIPPWLTKIPRSKLQCSCSEVLSFIAECCCGFFYMTSDDVCTFAPFGEFTSTMSVTRHTALDIGIEYTPAGILCTDGNGLQFGRGSTISTYDTVQINSDLITNTGCEEIWNRIDGETYTQYNCDTCVLPSVPYPAALINYAQGYDLITQDISCEITANGIFGTLRGNAPSDGEIGSRHRLTRNRVEYGKKCGNIINSKYQGIIVCEDDEE